LFPQIVDEDTIRWDLDFGEDDDNEDAGGHFARGHEIVGTRGRLKLSQPSALPGSYDAWVETFHGHQRPMRISAEEARETIDPDSVAPVSEFLVMDRHDPLSGSPMCFMVRRPDPLFRLRGCRLGFDERWPLPTAGLPLCFIAPSTSSEGWNDLGAAQELGQHVQAIGSVASVVGAFEYATRRADRLGGVALARGGGADWHEVFDDADVVAALRGAQRAGLVVMTGLGHSSDVTGVETAADYAWPTPSALGSVLSDWGAYLAAEATQPEDGMIAATYRAGLQVRAEFDRAWARHRGPAVCPRLDSAWGSGPTQRTTR
jgi:hypothetical protein